MDAAENETDPIDQTGKETRRLPSKASRQRFKPQLSCTFCRNRKLKCDRNNPCQNCTKRDLSSSCTYIHTGLRDKSSSIHKASGTSSGPKDVQGRVRHLEELVVSLMQQSAVQDAPPQSQSTSHEREGFCADVENKKKKSRLAEGRDLRDLGETSDSFGRISIEDEQSNYVGAQHWTAILDSIADLKDSLRGNESASEPEAVIAPTPQGPDLLVGAIPKATKTEILVALPPRYAADLLVERFFVTNEFSPYIHIPTFKREYEHFWSNPSAAPVMWIGLLFAIMCLSLNVSLLDPGKTSSLESQPLRDSHSAIKIFREKTVQCLVLGNYTEPTTYTVETLLMYFFTEHFRDSESHVGAWMVLGLVVRAAMRLGYHCDARHSPKIEVLRGEMQRRVWATVAHMDLQTSCRVGLPRMVKEGMFDTEPPRNLLDEDFDESTQALPPSRPLDYSTTITYPLIKYAITRVYGMIIDQTSSINPISYDEIMRLDVLLQDTHQQVPDFLKVHSVEDLQSGSPEIVVHKFSADLCYQRARCVLHRKYLAPSKAQNSPRHWYSVKTCVDAAMRILKSQAFMFEHSKPNTVLCNNKWKTSSLMAHDFLLAAMLICVHLNESIGTSILKSGVSEVRMRWSREEMLDALDGSYRIWDEESRTSKDALKAAKALERTLSRIRGARQAEGAILEKSPNSQPSTSGVNNTLLSDHFVSSTFNNEQFGVYQRQPTMAEHSRDSATMAGSWQGDVQFPFENDELDWDQWDNYFHNNLAGTPPDLWSLDAGTFVFVDNNDHVMEWGS